MTLNGNGRTAIMTAVLTTVVVIFVMLFSGLTGSVEGIQRRSQGNTERIVAIETELRGIDEKIDELKVGQKEMREDIKEILQALR